MLTSGAAKMQSDSVTLAAWQAWNEFRVNGRSFSRETLRRAFLTGFECGYAFRELMELAEEMAAL